MTPIAPAALDDAGNYINPAEYRRDLVRDIIRMIPILGYFGKDRLHAKVDAAEANGVESYRCKALRIRINSIK